MRAHPILLALGACTAGPRIPEGVAHYELALPADGTVKLARHLVVETELPSTLTVTTTTDDHEEHITFAGERTTHDVPLLGFLPDRTYEVRLELGTADGLLEIVDEIETEPLPAPWPQWEVLTSRPDRMEPGFTLLAVRADAEGLEYEIIIDAEGRVRWLQHLTGTDREVTTADTRMLADGTLLLTRNGEIRHHDLLGRLLHRLVPQDTPLGDEPGVIVPEAGSLFHHEVALLPDGSGVYSLGTRPHEVRDFPHSYTDPHDTRRATIADDVVLEVQWDGTVDGAWSLAERLDDTRIGWDSLDRRAGLMDWAHANAVVYDPVGDRYLITLRHQDALVQLSRATGEIDWVLAPTDHWSKEYEDLLLEPFGTGFKLSWHPHAAEYTPQGTVLVFDNHNYANSPLTGTASVLPHQNTSRIVEYAIDEDAGTVEQVWQFVEGPDGGFFSPGMGDADWQPQTGNVLGVWGRMTHERRRALADRGFGEQGVRILEVTHTPAPEVVFDLRLTSDRDELARGWTCNRAERIPSLYGAEVATLTSR